LHPFVAISRPMFVASFTQRDFSNKTPSPSPGFSWPVRVVANWVFCLPLGHWPVESWSKRGLAVPLVFATSLNCGAFCMEFIEASSNEVLCENGLPQECIVISDSAARSSGVVPLLPCPSGKKPGGQEKKRPDVHSRTNHDTGREKKHLM